MIPSASAAYRKGHTVEHPLLMTPAGRLCLRESLGLSPRALTKALGVYERYVYRWESSGQGLTRETADALADLVAYTEEAVAALVAAHEPGAVLTIYRTDTEFRDHVDTGGWVLSAEWHRAVAWRAKEQIPGARVDYRG